MNYLMNNANVFFAGFTIFISILGFGIISKELIKTIKRKKVSLTKIEKMLKCCNENKVYPYKKESFLKLKNKGYFSLDKPFEINDVHSNYSTENIYLNSSERVY